MQSFAAVLCQIWGQFRWNLVIYGSKCPILKGVHQIGQIAKRLIDTAGIEIIQATINVVSNMIGRSAVAVTRSDLMRVSHSWTPKLHILEILTHFWPESEPCRHANVKDMDCILPMRALPSFIDPPCKYEGMDMHSWSTVVCQIWGQFRWNLVLYGSKCPTLKGVHQTARSPNGL